MRTPLPVLKRIQKEAEYAQNCAVVLHCKAESHDLLAEYRGKSMPHFLFYRNGTQVASVAGANMPEIEALLREHAPTSADADVLEENPMWIQRQEEKAAAGGAQAALMGRTSEWFGFSWRGRVVIVHHNHILDWTASHSFIAWRTPRSIMSPRSRPVWRTLSRPCTASRPSPLARP